MTNLIHAMDHEIKRLQWPIAFATNVICCAAICLTIFFFTFNIRYRNFRLIKMSSPNVNNVINFSCLLLYVCPVFNSFKGLFVLNEPFTSSMCMVNQWLIPLCSTVIYTAMLAKAWRIYKIFDNSPKMKKVVIKDYRLFIYIGCMCAFDLTVLTLWQVFDTISIRGRFVYETTNQISTVVVSSNTTNSENGFTPTVQNLSHTSELKLVYECNSNYQEVWITALTMYKIILLMYGIYLAWIIRNVNVPSMNDSKYLLLSTYAIIICGLGSMTLTQLLKDWPDVVHVFFTLGILLATCITQCLVFIPKIRLWYKRRNDDNFKISLSQIFLNPSASSYFSSSKGKSNGKTAGSAQTPETINLEDELCQLLHENSQLKNFLKEKEEVIKLLQNKVRITKASFFQQNKPAPLVNTNDTSFSTIENKTQASDSSGVTGSITMTASTAKSLLNLSDSNCTTANNSQFIREQLNGDNDLRYSVSETKSTIKNDTCVKPASGYAPTTLGNTYTEQLRNDLDEVEALTSRVRDSISLDLSNTRRYSPLLFEYYRKQLELAKTIQGTYNIQCNTLFDAMTLMRSCLKDYCQTVHNPEYLAIDSINMNEDLTHKESTTKQGIFSFSEYLARNQQYKHTSLNLTTSNQTYSLPESVCELNADILRQKISQNASNLSENSLSSSKSISHVPKPRNIKNILLQRKENQSTTDTLNNTILTNLSSIQNTSVESALCSSSASSLSDSARKKSAGNVCAANESVFVVQTIDKKQTYV